MRLLVALLFVLSACGRGEPPTPIPAGTLFVSSGDPLEPGPLAVQIIDLEEGELGAPRPVRLHAPVEAGTYAVVQFQHGFLSDRRFYDEILGHLASHGFVVVAPQMYPADGVPLGKPTAESEAREAAKVAAWALRYAPTIAGSAAGPRPIGVAGHSRGGKVAWLLATDPNEGGDVLPDKVPTAGLVGVDPVDGRGGPLLSAQPEALAGPLRFAPPSLIIGMELGGSCAPAADGFRHFFENTAPPTSLVLVKGHGHADMLDADLGTEGLCAEGPERAKVRALTGGLLAAFFRSVLQGVGPRPDAALAARAPLEVVFEAR